MVFIQPGFNGFKYGCDPELFLYDADDKLIPAVGIIPGTKAEPYPVPGGAIQVDGVAAEFNINPAEDFQTFNGNIIKVLETLQKMLPPGFSARCNRASETFDLKSWRSLPESAKELGCHPDVNAWTGDFNPPPSEDMAGRTRCLGGHLHIGWTENRPPSDVEHILHCRDLVKQLDWYLGGWSVRKDHDKERRKLYGKAGACRYKPYGVEYRVLSSFWVHSEAYRIEVWNRMQKAIQNMRKTFMPDYAEKRMPNANQLLVHSINAGARNSSLERYFEMPIVATEI